MKKLLALTLISLFIVSLVGCSLATQPVVETVIETVLVEVPATQEKETVAETTETQSEKISEQEAKDIAFKHAKIKEADAKYVQTELDYDDGILRYEIDFYYDGYEYDYDIDAYSGKILSYDKDID